MGIDRGQVLSGLQRTFSTCEIILIYNSYYSFSLNIFYSKVSYLNHWDIKSIKLLFSFEQFKDIIKGLIHFLFPSLEDVPSSGHKAHLQ